MNQSLYLDIYGRLWLVTPDGDGNSHAQHLGHVENAEDRVPAGLEADYAALLAEWRDGREAAEAYRAEADYHWGQI